jgi:transketolase
MISLAGHLRLGKLILLWDDNRITDDGSTTLSISEDVARAFRVGGGTWSKSTGTTSKRCRRRWIARADPRPSMIACRTVIARGIARLQGQRGGHSGKPAARDAEIARPRARLAARALRGSRSVLRAWRAAGQRGATRTRVARTPAALPAAERAEFDRVSGRRTARGLARRARRTSDARRGAAMRRAASPCRPRSTICSPTCCRNAWSAAPTSKRPPATSAACRPSPPRQQRRLRALRRARARDGRDGQRHGGARRRAAAGVTYLAFSDYERPAMRMAALMGLPVKFVFSHDSIGVGKNGPTHQPVEILASLRAMPNMLVLRPADAVEAAECWEIALEHRAGRASLVFARQALPLVRRAHRDENLSRAALTCWPKPRAARARSRCWRPAPKSRSHLQAREQLAGEGVPTAVVSMPCCERFDEQDAAYRAAVLGRHRCASPWKRPCVSAGTAISASAAASSA